MAKCQNSACGITIHKRKCVLQYYTRILFKDGDIKRQFTLFHQSIVNIINLYNAMHETDVSITKLSEDVLEEVILSFETLEVTFDFTSSRVISLRE